jgi:hypothetical protein
MAQKDPYGDMIKAATAPVEHMSKVARQIDKNMKKAGYTKKR